VLFADEERLGARLKYLNHVSVCKANTECKVGLGIFLPLCALVLIFMAMCERVFLTPRLNQVKLDLEELVQFRVYPVVKHTLRRASRGHRLRAYLEWVHKDRSDRVEAR
jgi:hypothetical protein